MTRPTCYWCGKNAPAGIHQICWSLLKAFAMNYHQAEPPVEGISDRLTHQVRVSFDTAGRKLIGGRVMPTGDLHG